MKTLCPIYKRIGLQFVLLFGIYTLCRVLFFLANLSTFRELAAGEAVRILLYGLRYDAVAIAAINVLYVLLSLLPLRLTRFRAWERFLQILFVLTNGVALLFEVGDWVYFRYTGKRATADLLSLLVRPADFLNLVPGFVVDYWYAPLLMLVLGILLWRANRVIVRKTPLSPGRWRWPQYGLQTLGLFLSAGVLVLAIRGGAQRIPVGIRNAVQVTESRYVPLVLNTPFSIITSYATPALEDVQYMADSEAAKLFVVRKQAGGGPFRPVNVVVVIVESLSKEFTCLGPGPSYTPFLDSLMRIGLNCTQAYANGLHSAEGIPAVMAGIPTLMPEAFSTSIYGTNAITTIPGLLKKKGYSTAFYHGGTNGTMSFDIFAAAAGYEKYYGRTEYKNDADYDGSWGIPDGPFLQYFAAGLSKMKAPFCASVFTLSSHPPYKLPLAYASPLPKTEREEHKAVTYTDDALRAFFRTASAAPWFRSTLFVITADHAAPDSRIEHYGKGIGEYSIPIIFYAPGDRGLQGAFSRLAQQIDILPSVMHYLGYEAPFFAFGESVFDTAADRFVVTEKNGSYQWLDERGYVLRTAGDKPSGLFEYPADSSLKRNVLMQNRPAADNVLLRLKAFIQVYRGALIHNRMVE